MPNPTPNTSPTPAGLRNMSREQLIAECSYRGADLVIARAHISRLERKLNGTTDPHACPYDGRPCIASKGTEDEHFRCGTVQCGRSKPA